MQLPKSFWENNGLCIFFSEEGRGGEGGGGRQEVVWPSGEGACLAIRRSRVQDPFWPLIEFDPGSPWFNFPAALVNSQLVCPRPVGILSSCCFSLPSFRWVLLALKSPHGERPLKYVLYCMSKNVYYGECETGQLVSVDIYQKATYLCPVSCAIVPAVCRPNSWLTLNAPLAVAHSFPTSAIPVKS